MGFLYLFTVAAGIATALQAGANATLSKTLDQPFFAGLVVLAVNAVLILGIGLASGRLGLPDWGAVGRVPWWAWLGGAFGGLLVLSQLFVAQAIGAGAFVGITVVASTIASLVLDHYGLMGFKEHAANGWRVLGGTLMSAGVLFVALF